MLGASDTSCPKVSGCCLPVTCRREYGQLGQIHNLRSFSLADSIINGTHDRLVRIEGLMYQLFLSCKFQGG